MAIEVPRANPAISLLNNAARNIFERMLYRIDRDKCQRISRVIRASATVTVDVSCWMRAEIRVLTDAVGNGRACRQALVRSILRNNFYSAVLLQDDRSGECDRSARSPMG